MIYKSLSFEVIFLPESRNFIMSDNCQLNTAILVSVTQNLNVGYSKFPKSLGFANFVFSNIFPLKYWITKKQNNWKYYLLVFFTLRLFRHGCWGKLLSVCNDFLIQITLNLINDVQNNRKYFSACLTWFSLPQLNENLNLALWEFL